jgi:AcrR family transcriptional regulator
MGTADYADSRGALDSPGRTRLPAAERRETILTAATEVFAEAGYHGGKVSDIAARVGVTEPVVFQNFGSKAGLFAAVLERAAAAVRASLDKLAAESGSASGLLAHVLDAAGHLTPGHSVTHSIGPHSGAGRPAAAYAVLFADAAALSAQPELTEPARVAVGAVAAHLTDLIRHAQTHEAIADQVDPEAAAWLLVSVMSAHRLRAAVMPASLEPAVVALALRALAPRSGARGPTRVGSR